ncbi:MAG: hypothetical protein JSV33_03645 [bacterium]|nr:MAG: hypothetical protein JSV33_03645 [bacterium]
MPDILSFLSGGLIGGFLGAFLGGFAKFFWEQWLPSWLTWRKEQRVQREKVLSQIRGPAMRAISDLQSRIFVILRSDPKDPEDYNYLYLKGKGQEDYYINSTAFLVAQFFAWEEVLRQRMAALDYSELVTRLDRVTTSFAHGGRGFQIFRLEQREIGERMLARSPDSGKECIGYSEYLRLIEKDEVPVCFKRLDERVQHLLDHPSEEVIRMLLIQHSLIDLVNFIDPDGRWVPKGRRSKVDSVWKIDQLATDKLITRKQYESMMSIVDRLGLAQKKLSSLNLKM